jgi:chitodextrinase
VVSDIDAGETITATLTLSNPAAGSLTTAGVATYDPATGVWRVTGTAPDVNAALAAVAFVPAAGNTTGATIATLVRDAAGTGPDAGVISLTALVKSQPQIAWSPLIGEIGQPVVFTPPALDPNAGPYTYLWNFGDGTTSTEPSPSHLYTAPGEYTVTVTVTDASGATFTQNGVLPVLDTTWPLLNTKTTIRLNFVNPSADAIVLRTTFVIPEGIALTGQRLDIDLGGVQKSYMLDDKGMARSGGDVIKVASRGKAQRTAKLTAVLLRGNFSAALADEGLTAEVARNKDARVMVTLVFNGTTYQRNQAQKYSNPRGLIGISRGK